MTTTPHTDPAEAAAEGLCPLAPDKPIAAVWKRDAAQLIHSHYRPLLEQAHTALANCLRQLHDQQAMPDASGDARYRAALIALNQALGAEPAK